MILLRILLGILGLVAFGYGVRCFHRDHYKSALACLGFAAIFLLTDPTSFQGFLKAGIIAKLNSLGRTVDTIQDTLVEQQNALQSHQDEIKNQQLKLGEQQDLISCAQSTIRTQQVQVMEQQKVLDTQADHLRAMQIDLFCTQTNISKQQEQIADVEFLVQNLFSKTKTEKIFASDTNRVFHVKHGDGAILILFLLEKPAIKNSISGYFGNESMKPNIANIYNVVISTFVGKWDTWKDFEFNFSYVVDSGENNNIKNIEVKNNKVYLDGKWLPLADDQVASDKSDDAERSPVKTEGEQSTDGRN